MKDPLTTQIWDRKIDEGSPHHYEIPHQLPLFVGWRNISNEFPIPSLVSEKMSHHNFLKEERKLLFIPERERDERIPALEDGLKNIFDPQRKISHHNRFSFWSNPRPNKGKGIDEKIPWQFSCPKHTLTFQGYFECIPSPFGSLHKPSASSTNS